jgi:glycosyltransferase involved in cell wall biosynthesis
MVRERVNVMHGFTIKCAVYGSLAARLAGVSARLNAVAGMGYVFTSPELKARALRPVVRNLLRLALQGRSARLVLQNPDDVALFKRARLVDSASIRLIPGSGVDCRRFTPDFTRIPGGRFRVLLAARLLWDKGLDEYVSAARELKAQGRDIEFLLAGSPDPGNPTAVPEETVQAWGKERLVILLGHIDDMPALFRSVDAVILPSYREGLPKGLVEAGACGLALVATDVPGCREVVTDGVDGLLVPVRDFKALAAAIARLQDTPALAARLGVAAREKALREFDERIVIERTLRVYDELLQTI